MTSVSPPLTQIYAAGKDPSPQSKVNASNLDSQTLAIIAFANQLNNAVSQFLRDDNSPIDASVPLRALTADVQAMLGSFAGWKPRVGVACATIGANITLFGEQTLDGFTTNGSRVLVKDQTIAGQNAIYISGAGAWTLDPAYPIGTDTGYHIVTVQGGLTNILTSWICANPPGSAILGVATSIKWTRFGGSGGLASFINGGTGATQPNQWPSSRRLMARVVATGPLTIGSPGATIDGVAMAAGDRVLCVAQSTATQNGPWVWQTSTTQMTRPVDYPTGGILQAFQDLEIPIREGAVYAGNVWRCATAGAITIDTTATTWSEEIIPINALASAVILQIDTIAALKALTPPLNSVTYLVRGYYGIGDGGGGHFRWNAADSTADNGGTVIAPAAGSGRWNRVYSGRTIFSQWFGTKGDGSTNDGPAFRAMLAWISAQGGGQLRVSTPATSYLITIASDSDSLVVPSYTDVVCDQGVSFTYGNWGSPLFAIVNVSHVSLTGAKFIWTGTFSTTSGFRTAFGYTYGRPAYEWCAHIVCCGSDHVRIADCECVGATTANTQNNFINMLGNQDGSLTDGNVVERLIINDVCQGIAIGGQSRAIVRNLKANRFSSASAGLYGPPHVVYHILDSTYAISDSCIFSDLIDDGTPINAYCSGAVSFQFKGLSNSIIANLYSARASGLMSLMNWIGNTVRGAKWYNATADVDTVIGGIYFINPSIPNHDNDFFDITLITDIARNFVPFNMGGVAASTSNLRCRISGLRITRTCDGSESTASLYWVGDNGSVADFVHTNKGSAGKVVIDVHNGSTGCVFDLLAIGAEDDPSVAVSSGTNNLFNVRTDAVPNAPVNEFIPAGGNFANWQSLGRYTASRALGSGTNPTCTIQLPKAGAWLVWLNLISNDSLNALSGLYLVVWDGAATPFTTAQLIGSQPTKGGSAPSALGLAVSNAGVLAMTSTAASNTWKLQYGYGQLGTN